MNDDGLMFDKKTIVFPEIYRPVTSAYLTFIGRELSMNNSTFLSES